MKNLKITIIGGFRKDQHYSIDADEAHKAYVLFFNPEARAIFKNGLAIIGADVRGIEPDYNGSMGWNPTHTLDADDRYEIRQNGIDRKLRDVLNFAREVALNHPEKINLPLSKIKLLGNKKYGEEPDGTKVLLGDKK